MAITGVLTLENCNIPRVKSSYKIKEITNNDFKSLVQLNLHRYRIRSIQEDSFVGLENLQELDLNHNKLKILCKNP